MSIREFMKENYRHFNAATTLDASEAWVRHLDKGGKMLLAMAGAMSTGEIGISLAEMIRQEKIHAVSTTGANLEEDVFNLVAHDHYRRIPRYRDLSPKEELDLCKKGLNRVTDTCIPEEEAMRRIEKKLLRVWKKAAEENKSYFPYEYFYQLLQNGDLKEFYQIDPKHSWVLAASEKGIPIYTPGWEDSTLGNVFVSNVIKGNVKNYHAVKSGLEQMAHLVGWYREHVKKSSIGFFQIGGGIAGDFPICVVPLIMQDLRQECPLWGYFAQISDSTTSYGSYSGAVPNEKITWCKIDIDTPSFVIESDASLVAPLIFNYVLGN
ncbi:MAG: deoxyhypusine synthase family protein [Deltaproteobacteria bacterium]|nr:deoxyhypusine synthase family protein [Deltaproteobacteria bacterium]